MKTESHNTKKQVLKSAGVVGGMTLWSRVIGMIRDMVNANIFGINPVWDAFVFAFMIPNFLRRLLGEGALSGAFVPLYAELSANKGAEEANRFANVIISVLIVSMSAVLGLFCIAAFFTLQFFTLPMRVELILNLLQIFTPYIIMLCVISVIVGVLNCYNKFFVPSLIPVILNLGWIVVLYAVCMRFGDTLQQKAYYLAAGILLIGVIQSWVQWAAVRKVGFKFRFSLDFKNPVFQRLVKLMIPAIFAYSVMQINIFVDQCLGFMIGAGANSALWYGNRIMQFPLGMFGIAMGTVLLPTVAQQAAKGDIEQMKDTLSFSLRAVFLITVPAMVGLAVLSKPIVAMLFQSGLFDDEASTRAGRTLLGYALGLCSFSAAKLLLPIFYSMKDTKTPMWTSIVAMVLNIVFILCLMVPFREMGIALATTLSSTINAIMLYSILRKRIGRIGALVVPFVKVSVASIVMGAIVWSMYTYVHLVTFSHERLTMCFNVLAAITTGIVVYGVLCLLLQVKEVYRAWDLFVVPVLKRFAKKRA